MKATQKITLSINPIAIICILVAVIIAMLAMWQPWHNPRLERTITIAGQGQVESIPDEFTFSPYFQRTGSNTAALKAELDNYGNTLLNEVVKLGVKKDDVTLNSNNFIQSGAAEIAPDKATQQNIVSLYVTIKTSSKETAQKIQDYLAQTDAQGQTTSHPSFSKKKNQELENQARDNATKDARAKAERTAKTVNAKVGKVVSVKETSSSGPVYPVAMDSAEGSARSSLPVTPGKNTVTSNVEVVFELQ